MTLFLGSWEILFLLLIFLITVGILSSAKKTKKEIPFLSTQENPRIRGDKAKKEKYPVSNADSIDVFSTVLFYVRHDEHKEGPYNLKQIKDYPLRPDTLITTNTLGGAWYRADQFDCLKELFSIGDSYKINSDGEIIRRN